MTSSNLPRPGEKPALAPRHDAASAARGEEARDPKQVSPRTEAFYGWVVTFASLGVTTTAFGVFYSFGVFFSPWVKEWSASRALLSGVFSLTFLVYGLASLGMGVLSDRLGLKKTLAMGGFVMGLGCLLAARATHLWQVYVTWGVMVGLGVGTSYSPTAAAVSRWFGRRKGLAVGIVVSGLGFGALFFPPLCERIVSWAGWRYAAQTLGIIVWVAYFGAALMVREAPRAATVSSIGVAGHRLRDAWKEPTLWILFTIHGLWVLGMSMPMVHLVPLCRDLGIPSSTSAEMLATMGGMSVLGRICLASATNRLGARRTLMLLLWVQATTMLLGAWGNSAAVLWGFAVLFGFSYGGVAAVFPIATAEYFGLQALGAIFGLILLGATLGGTLGPVVAGFAFDVTHRYSAGFLVGALSMAIGALLPLRLPRRAPCA